MPVLSRAITETFAEFIFQRMGVDRTLTATEIDKLCRDSRGNIGEIKARLEQLLIERSSEPLSTSKRSVGLSNLPILKIVGALVFAGVVGGVLIFQEHINNLFDATPLNEPPLLSPDADKVEMPITAKGDMGAADEDVEGSPLRELPGEETVPVTLPEIQDQPVQQAGAGLPVRVPIEAPQDASEPTLEVELLPSETIVPNNISEPEVQAISVASDSTTASQPDPLPVVASSDKSVEKKPDVAPQADQPAPSVSEVAKPEPQTTSTPYTEAEQQLLQQKPTAYTLQLIGVGNESGAKKYIKRYALGAEARYFRTFLNGRDWYAVVYGVYPDRAAALTARQKLSKRLNKKDIWPRDLKSVHAALQQRN
ncbi:MAG: SPOR domain-containing protein [Chromatiales bacterium]|nr:SPOR domain-containing protein [Chromatiales bacterium]